MRSVLLAVLGAFAGSASGQTIHTVIVGISGSFYDPPTVSALQGDIVNFVFGGEIHTVTQSTFETPCIPLPGGFNSGLAGIGTNSTAPVPVWSLTVTNSSETIWYFCQATRPESHCAAGMVGAINPPSAAQFQAFQSSAKAVSGTPTPTVSVVLSGFGAVATNTPAPTTTVPPAQVTPASSSTGSSSPSSTATSSTSSISALPTSSSKSSTGAAVGGGVGGGVALVIIAILVFLLLRAKRRSKAVIHDDRETSEQYDSAKFVTPQRTGGSDRILGGDTRQSNMSWDPTGNYRRTQPELLHQPSAGTFDAIPSRLAYQDTSPSQSEFQEPPNSASMLLDHRTTQYTDARMDAAPGRQSPGRPQDMNVHELAKEVAALLRPAQPAMPPSPPLPQHDLVSPRPVRQLPNPLLSPRSPGPPQYRL